jgi:arylsulfatase A-like enzyme
MDLGPTVLDLAGIRIPNAYMGHSLLRPAAPDRQFSFCMRGEQALAERGNFRWHGAWGAVPREQGEELFDIVRDRLERRNLFPEHPALRDSLRLLAQTLARLHILAVENNRIWPDGL